MKKQINYDALTECVIAIMSGIVFIAKVVDGSYLKFVSPKFKALLILAGILLLLIGISRVPYIWKQSYGSHFRRYLLLAIPMLMLVVPHDSIAASALENSYSGSSFNNTTTQVNKNTDASNSGITDTTASSTDLSETETSDIVSSDTATSDTATSDIDTSMSGTSDEPELDTETQLSGLDRSAKTIMVSDEEFYQWIEEFYSHYEKYEGYEVSIKGMKYQDSTISGNEFAVVRLAMVCCAADLAPCGPLCQYDQTDSLELDQWYMVTGTLGSETIDGQIDIILNVIKVEEASAPKEPYVYPYY